MGGMRGKTILPWRYGMFLALLSVVAPIALVLPWHEAAMAGFDVAVLGFILSLVPLIDDQPDQMRRNAAANDANRGVMLLITAVVTLVILIAVGVAVGQKGGPSPALIALLLATLTLAWLFSNMVYAVHYAHIYYLPGPEGGDCNGLDFPGDGEPGYWDFIYFAFTLGMTFQTSDVQIQSSAMRRAALAHSLAAFIFNLGVLAFTINVLGN